MPDTKFKNDCYGLRLLLTASVVALAQGVTHDLKSLFANQNTAVSIAANCGRACHQRDNRVGTGGIRLRACVLGQ